MSTEESLIQYIRSLFEGESSGHDYFHSIRVYRTALQLVNEIPCDKEIIMMAALLHDVDDVKLFSTENYQNARKALAECSTTAERAEQVIDIIKAVSFKGKDSVVPNSIEGKIVQDADRLDAMGAIGIARAFAFGGSRGRVMYDPSIPPALDMSKDEYLHNKGTTINHFYEKLLLVGGMLNTESAKRLAAGRQRHMEEFLDEFYAEWNGER